MRGTMLWFNGLKDLGVIVAEDGERLPVNGCDFVGGARPPERCARAAVSYEVNAAGERRATHAALVPEEEHGRARLRRHGTRIL